VLLSPALPVPALAQSVPLAGALEVAGGVLWTGELSNGTQGAFETTPSEGRYALFQTRTVLAPAAGFEGSLSLRLGPSVDVRGHTSYASSDLRTAISADVEGVPDIVASEAVTQLAVEGALVVRLPNWRPTDRATPFVSGGGGYLRHLHEGRILVENGITFHLGGGLDYLLKSAGWGAVKATGLRVDVRSVWRKGGVAFDDRSHVSPAVGVSLFARF
jgi:hypothetical protein